jgi:hypothetical protein
MKEDGNGKDERSRRAQILEKERELTMRLQQT